MAENRLKVVKVKGGLGNQMFQYAFHRLLQEKYQCENVKLDLTYYGDTGVDDIRLSRLGRMNTQFQTANDEELRKVCLFRHTGKPLSRGYRLRVGLDAKLNPRYYFEENRAYREVDKLLRYQYYDGYWQSWRYLEPITDKLKKEFCCNTLSEKARGYMARFEKCNSVFVGVRRGDYLGNDKTVRHYGQTDIEYYIATVNYMKKNLKDPVFIFFTNDLPWVKDHLTPEVLGIAAESVIYREQEDITDDFEELFVMSACNHAIITNSTFNFWGAWLINNPDKIIAAPKDWFKDDKPIDIVPDNWKRF